MKDFIVGAVLIIIIGAIIYYLYKSKKRGDKCVGCPYGSQCSRGCSGGCSAESERDK